MQFNKRNSITFIQIATQERPTWNLGTKVNTGETAVMPAGGTWTNTAYLTWSWHLLMPPSMGNEIFYDGMWWGDEVEFSRWICAMCCCFLDFGRWFLAEIGLLRGKGWLIVMWYNGCGFNPTLSKFIPFDCPHPSNETSNQVSFLELIDWLISLRPLCTQGLRKSFKGKVKSVSCGRSLTWFL